MTRARLRGGRPRPDGRRRRRARRHRQQRARRQRRRGSSPRATSRTVRFSTCIRDRGRDERRERSRRQRRGVRRLVARVRRRSSHATRRRLAAVVGTDNPAAAALAARPRAARTVTFGFGDADVAARARRIRGLRLALRPASRATCATRQRSRCTSPARSTCRTRWPPSASAIALGVPFATASPRRCERFHGVRRRFEIVARSPRMTIVDDYAHHPTAVDATIAAARAYCAGPIVVAFQPHRYTRTRYLAREFARALRGADRVLLAPVYAASEAADAGRRRGDRSASRCARWAATSPTSTRVGRAARRRARARRRRARSC